MSILRIRNEKMAKTARNTFRNSDFQNRGVSPWIVGVCKFATAYYLNLKKFEKFDNIEGLLFMLLHSLSK